MRSVLVLGVAALMLGALVPETAEAKPRPGVKKGFRLFARAGGALTINRIYCGLQSNGQVCVDSTNSSTIGGGFWPKGTADQYVFNSGIQVAGIIGDDANPEWAGDTTGGQLFSPRGDDHGEEVQPVYNSSDPNDVASWPQAALVPQGDATADLYNPLLQGRVSASQGDVWFVSTEGNPAFGAGRQHPLGILVEQRGLGYNFPAGNEDILYFVYTFYNATASDPAVYAAAGIRPGMVDIVAEAGARFQTLNEASFGINIPDGGYTITDMFAAFGADMDVANAPTNYASVNVPFSLGYTYDNTFSGASGWTFDPTIFGAPFFPGSGFVGVKYLKSPVVAGEEVGLTLFSNTINAGAFDDAQNAVQLYRYLSNNISTAAGDAACNTGDPQVTRICYINNAQPQDMRFFQASGPLQLAPGQSGSIVVAYIFAAPVSVGACTGPGTCDLPPGDPTLLADAAGLATTGANPVDSVTGFTGFEDVNGDGEVQQDEVQTVTGSLLNKALVAQSVFDAKFLTPFAPETPGFFLIPGDNSVTVIWQPTTSETTGDPYFTVANVPTVIPEGSTDPVPNPLYDPNYRQFDIEGYRVYRGRVDSPNSLRLIAQFDYAGTVFTDFTSQVNPTAGCAPEIGVNTITTAPNPDDPTVTDTTFGCPVPFDSLVPGVPADGPSVDVPLVGQITQLRRDFGERQKLANTEAVILKLDTLSAGDVGGCLRAGGSLETCTLRDTGVPFTFVDQGARNNLRYFYAVTAFDVNSLQSAPSALESPRTAKPVTPVAGASNYENTASLTLSVSGRDVVQDRPEPTLDPATGKFSGPQQPADGGDLHFAGELARQVLAAPGAMAVRLDSLTLGSAYDVVPNVYYMTATGGSGATFEFSIPVTQDQFEVENNGVAFFEGVPVDAALAARYGGNATFALRAEHAQRLAGNYYTNAWGRGCINAAEGFGDGLSCNYNGARWFSGPNETQDHPNAGNQANSGGPTVPTDFNNVGALPGVAVIHQDLSYQTVNNTWRNIEGVLGGASRAADYNVYWGEGGTIDSVIDVTHNVPVAFGPNVGASWGILNASATGTGSADAVATLSAMDMGCVEPLLSSAAVQSTIPCTDAAYQLSQTAVLGPVGYMVTGFTLVPGAGQGFILYLPGHFSTFELPPGGTLPADGTVWTLRTYTGAITGGQGQGGNQGAYAFFGATRPFSAVGAEVLLNFEVVNQLAAATRSDLSRVHTVPDPYYVTSAFEQTTDSKIIKFVNLPAKAIVRIYSSSGVLVSLLEHNSATFGGSVDWNVRNRNNQVVASGVYFYHIEAGDARRVGRFTVVNFAQ